MNAVWANDDYVLRNFSVIQSSLVRVRPTIPYLICSQLAWFSLSVKNHVEWFIRLSPQTPKGQPAGWGKISCAEFYFAWNIATLGVFLLLKEFKVLPELVLDDTAVFTYQAVHSRLQNMSSHSSFHEAPSSSPSLSSSLQGVSNDSANSLFWPFQDMFSFSFSPSLLVSSGCHYKNNIDWVA